MDWRGAAFACRNERVPFWLLRSDRLKRVANRRLPGTAPDSVPRLRNSVEAPADYLSPFRVLDFDSAMGRSREPPVDHPFKTFRTQ